MMLAIAATGVFTREFVTALVAGGVVAGVPLLFAALGEMISERGGVLNLGLEGMMLVGAYTGFVGAHYLGSFWIGFITGAAGGLLVGCVMAVLAVRFRLDQVVVGLGLLLLAEGTTSVLQYAQFGTDYPRLGEARSVPIPLLTHAPIVGKSVFDQPLLTYGSVVLVVLVWLLFRRTNFGLNLRAAGEQPAALDAAGVSVVATRVWGTLAAGAFGGLGGAYLSIVGAGVFVPLMTNGQGFIALAIAILAVDRPFTALIASFVFGMALSVTSALQIAGIQVSTDLVNMIPFAAMLVALWLLARSSAMPRALGLPYMRGSA